MPRLPSRTCYTCEYRERSMFERPCSVCDPEKNHPHWEHRIYSAVERVSE